MGVSQRPKALIAAIILASKNFIIIPKIRKYLGLTVQCYETDYELYMHFAYENMTHALSKFELKRRKPACSTYNAQKIDNVPW
jgi:hypothetical protein